MKIDKIRIEGFKRFRNFDLDLNPEFNVIVGDNETGKSSILEAIGLVLNRQYDGRTIDYTIDPYLFNTEMVAEFFEKRRNGEQATPPRVLIEAYFQDDPGDQELARLKGSNNTKTEDCPGLELTIAVDDDHVESLKAYADEQTNPVVLPVEFYRVTVRSFAGNTLTLRNQPFRATTIDTNIPRVYRGPNAYLAQVVNDLLTDEQRRNLSLAYKRLRHGFSQETGITEINQHLEEQGNPATDKKLSVQMDMSSRSTWDRAVTAHLDDLPFDCVGKGEQCRVQLRLAIACAQPTRVLLIEEPENHLSHTNLNILMEDIRKDCVDRQLIVTTHSAFVLNKLGIDNLKLISHEGRTASLANLEESTRDYFMKLPGYDTLRLILSKRSILVEGPSDELVVQRAYKNKHGKLPLENGVDVISVRSLAFKRFLQIAEPLELNVCVVTDNDGNVSALERKYNGYLNDQFPGIRICYSTDEDSKTLEPQILRVNTLETINSILGTTHENEDALLGYMTGHKTEYALTMFESDQEWNAPEYIADAIDRE